MMLQWCYIGVTMVLQWCYNGVTMAIEIKLKPTASENIVLEKCYNEVKIGSTKC
jgi:hypothetical protein